MTLKVHTQLLQITDVLPNSLIGTTLANFNMSDVANGHFSFAYHNVGGLAFDQPLFTIKCVAQSEGSLTKALSLVNRMTPTMAFDAAGNRYDVAMRFGTTQTLVNAEFEVFQNTPNPFNERTQIGVALPEASDVVLTIFDGTGRTLYTTEKNLPKGLHSFEILSGSLPVQGLLYYRVETAFGSTEKKMIHMNR